MLSGGRCSVRRCFAGAAAICGDDAADCFSFATSTRHWLLFDTAVIAAAAVQFYAAATAVAFARTAADAARSYALSCSLLIT